MQPNEFTLTVDELNDGDTTADVNQVYTRFDEYQNRTIYIGAEHSLTSRDQITFYRSLPKQNGNFKGMAKSSVKLTEDIVVPGVDSSTELTSPQIGEASFSFPVGTTPAQTLAFRQRMVALIDHEIMTALNDQLMI